MSLDKETLRVALLTYRGNPHSGGQGVYVHYLSAALRDLGHHVEVFSGPPYPDVPASVALTKVPSLELYRADDPFRRPAREEFTSAIDVLEYGLMCTAAYPEPLTFSLRAASLLRKRVGDFDIVHDNQCLGYGLLDVQRRGLPIVATLHHPISLDLKLELANADERKKRLSLRRWYSFTRMQKRVARRVMRVIAVSESAAREAEVEFDLSSDRVTVIHNGVDADLFTPLESVAAKPGRIITTASADVPLKGLVFLIEALAKLRTERDVELVVVGKARAHGSVRQAIDRLGVGDAVRFETGVSTLRLVELYAESEVAVVPSLYEGFSLPAVEAMSCGVPLITTTAGALPEVVGRSGEAAVTVPPSDAEALAAAIRALLDDPRERQRLAGAGRKRVIERFTWERAALATTDQYRQVLSC
ncbi:MAG: glycosyltransferase family 4 protein [Actinomycetota bacterium]|nr:glycosyltransferase family 4 protein [Actinomycetota bacterium]